MFQPSYSVSFLVALHGYAVFLTIILLTELIIISGGQTGVDQAALQAAIDCDVEHGGWCPPGRICETGVIPSYFHLSETPVERDSTAMNIPRSQRTIWNVRDADGILIITHPKLQSDRGTELAIETAKKLKRPFLIVDLLADVKISQIKSWVLTNEIKTLSIGGPSERTSPGIYDLSHALLIQILK